MWTYVYGSDGGNQSDVWIQDLFHKGEPIPGTVTLSEGYSVLLLS